MSLKGVGSNQVKLNEGEDIIEMCQREGLC